MPVINSVYKAPFWCRNWHVATIMPSMFRKVAVRYDRERLELPDGDFLDIDWLGKGRAKVLVISHGLEGNSQRHYVTALAKYFYDRDWGVAAWNARSCSGEMNRLPRLYSHIDAPDLAEVVNHVVMKGGRQVAIAGISMGGAITLNYLTKYKDRHPNELIGAVAISAPTDVEGSSVELEKSKNKFYRNRFLKKMLNRVVEKEKQFPELVDVAGIDRVRTFEAYDKRFTAPLNKCRDRDEFYIKANTHNQLADIDRPTLLLIARDDPFMPESCYPYEAAGKNKHLHLEVPKHGGHTGFILGPLTKSYMEVRSYDFLQELI